MAAPSAAVKQRRPGRLKAGLRPALLLYFTSPLLLFWGGYFQSPGAPGLMNVPFTLRGDKMRGDYEHDYDNEFIGSRRAGIAAKLHAYFLCFFVPFCGYSYYFQDSR